MGLELTCCRRPAASSTGMGTWHLTLQILADGFREAVSSSGRRLSNFGADSSLHGHMMSVSNCVP